MKKWILLATLVLGIIGILLSTTQHKEKKSLPTIADDFETLTGKDLPAWSYVQTKEDLEHLHFFKRMYELKKGFLSAASQTARIPKVIHFIWLGPRQFPRESIENVRTWMAKNPDWEFHFWTDRSRPLPCPGMKLRKIQDLPFIKLRTCFAKSDNYGEKSDLLRYEILYQEGGIYVDHDVKCFKSFDPLNHNYDFYCGIDMPYTSSLPSCMFTTNNLIGAKAGHPILLKCMELLTEQWDTIEQEYPGTDRDSMLNRVLHRTFWLFGEAIKQAIDQGDNRDIVFPAYYFDAPKDELALFARHQYAGAWHEKESEFEKMVRERLMRLSKKSNQTLLLVGVISALNLVGFVFLWWNLRKQFTKRSRTN
jgi:hypothetical protein